MASTVPLTSTGAGETGNDPRGELADLRVAYVVQMFPKLSHAFIQREVAGLRGAGATIEVYSLVRAPASELRSVADQTEASTTTALRPVSLLRLGRAHVRAASAAPAAYVATLASALRSSPRGLRAHIWQLLYFGQAVLLHDLARLRTPRHLHAHLANVATDVTWLAAELGNRSGSGPWTWSFTMHGPTEFRDVRRFNLARKVVAADLVVCISDYCRSQLMSLVPPETWSKLVIVRCGADLARYPFTDRADRPVRRLLCVGRLVPEKAQAVLLDAVALLRRRGVDVHLTLVGDGPDRERLHAHRARSGLGDAVEMPGALGQDELVGQFADADLFVMASFEEGVPVVLMEAMASGLPVVATRIAGIPELVDDEVSGRLVPPGRADALADAVQELVGDAAQRRRLADAARRTIGAEFDSRTEARRLGRLLLGVRRG